MISAIVLAAGLSRRMGEFKILLPWRDRTVVEQIVDTLGAAGLSDILVVTGNQAEDVTAKLAATRARTVFNPRFADGEMLSSIQAGLSALQALQRPDSHEPAAALLCLGDQPQIEVSTVEAVMAAGLAGECGRVIIPSYQMRAGHPILLPRHLWPAVLAATDHLRGVLKARPDCVDYVTVDTPTILADLDTPEDYEQARRNG